MWNEGEEKGSQVAEEASVVAAPAAVAALILSVERVQCLFGTCWSMAVLLPGQPFNSKGGGRGCVCGSWRPPVRGRVGGVRKDALHGREKRCRWCGSKDNRLMRE
jgi:hypothetical protein